MATPAQIEEQVNFERDAIQCGLNKLRKNTKDLEDKQYADIPKKAKLCSMITSTNYLKRSF